MKLKKYSVVIYAIVLFLLSVSFVVYIFPKGKQFQYSFSEGSPWLHDDLMASFDFPVYKTQDEMDFENDSIVNNFIPYFVKDTVAYKVVTQGFYKKINLLFDEGISSSSDSLNFSEFEKSVFQKQFEFFVDRVDLIVTDAYEKGLINVPDTVENINNFRFYLFENRVSELNYSGSYYKKESVETDILEMFRKSEVFELDSLAGFPIYNFIKSYQFKGNIVFDSELSNQILNSQLEALSPTRGIVQKGELIILKGSIVGSYENKVLLSLKKETENDDSDVNHYVISIGVALLFLVLYMVVFLYLYYMDRDVLYSFKANTFFTLQMMLLILSVILLFTYTDVNINVIPYALFPLLLLTFYKFNVSFIVYFASIFVAGFFAPNSFEFIFTQTLVGIIAMFSLRNTTKRKQIFVSMLIVFFSYMVLHAGFILMKQGDFSELLTRDIYIYGISSMLILLYLPIVYLYERMFGFLSDFTLMELSDTNNPALRDLAEKSPGTFQHSVQVANLVESVVREIGGNHLLARTGALYHDIGKSAHPEYFIENQSGANIHDKMNFEESAQKIISHVNYGRELARKYKLPNQIVDYITMHHGTSLTRYFYNSWVNENPNSTPNVESFKYPGPRPNSIETVVMMMADAIEAASRTLPEYTPESIKKIVHAIIDSQLNGGQYDDVDITLKQISKAKDLFTAKIGNIYHSRIVYPEINK